MSALHDRLAAVRDAGLAVGCRRWPSTDPPELHGYTMFVSPRGHGTGHDLFSPVAAAQRALGEAIERHVALDAALPREAVAIATPAELNGAALSLSSLAGYSPALRARDPQRFDWAADSEFAWVRAVSPATDEECWVPLQLVGRVTPTCGSRREPELAPRVTTGLAAHPDRTMAILHGLLEVIERDAFMLTWLGKVVPDVLDLDTTTSEECASVTERLTAAGLEVHALLLRTDVPAAVVLAVLHDPTGAGPAITVGAAARRRPHEAATAALTEALGTRRWLGGKHGAANAPPADTSRFGQRERLDWWAQHGRWPLLQWMFEGRRVIANCDGAASSDDAPAYLGELLGWFRRAGESVYVVDLTDEERAARLGHHVVRVLVPGFHPMHLDEERPATWSRRLSERLRAHPEALNPLPHPFP